MSKRPHRECNEDRWRRKIKEYEAKLMTKKRRRVIYSSGSDSDDAYDVQIEEHPHLDTEDVPEDQDTSRTLSAPSPPLPSPPPPSPLPPSPPPPSSPAPAPAVDPDLLLALGDSQKDTPEWGEDILQDISQRWDPILKQGLKKEFKEELFNKYLYPKNVPLAKPPILNPEISAMLTDPSRNRDKRVSSKQSQLGRAIAALGKAMSGILTKSMTNPELVRTLNDVGKLIADSHYLETDTRRSLITPLLYKSYVTPFKDRRRDSFLFGENLGEFIKSSRGIKKTGQLITPPAPSTSSANLNWKGPLRQQQTNRQPPAQRSGGQRAAAPAPRRVRAPPPPPPPPRRAPPPSTSRRPAATSSTSRSRRAT